MADTTDVKIDASDERDFTPPLVDGIEVPSCMCDGCDPEYQQKRRSAAFHMIHQHVCPRYCPICMIVQPCAKHRACNYIFYLSHPLASGEYQF